MPLAPRPAPGPPAALRLKRPRAAPAPDLLRVRGAAPPAKRPRTISSSVAALSLESQASPPPPPRRPPRRATFRRADPSAPGVRLAIAKGGVVDVAARLLRHEGFGKDGKVANGTRREAGAVMLCDGLAMVRERLCDASDDATTGIVDMQAGSAASGLSGEGTEEDDFVYDVYLRDEDCDAHPVVGDATGSGDDAGDEAVLMATDVPDVLFWGDEDGAESSDDEPGDAYLEDSEGSVDYPSTPDSEAYVGEVVDESADSDESDEENEETWQERRTRFGGARAFAVGTSNFGGVVHCDDREADDGFYDGSEEGGDVGLFDGGDDNYRRCTGEDVDSDAVDDECDNESDE